MNNTYKEIILEITDKLDDILIEVGDRLHDLAPEPTNHEKIKNLRKNVDTSSEEFVNFQTTLVRAVSVMSYFLDLPRDRVDARWEDDNTVLAMAIASLTGLANQLMRRIDEGPAEEREAHEAELERVQNQLWEVFSVRHELSIDRE